MAKIIIADDNDVFREVVASTLEEGYNVIQVTNGEDVLAQIGGSDISLLITDQNMPGQWRGSDIVNELKKKQINLPTILMSSMVDESLERFAKKQKVYLIPKLDFGDIIGQFQQIVAELIEKGDSPTYHSIYPNS